MSKFQTLKAEDLLDVISNTSMMRKWLSNPTALQLFKDLVFDALEDTTTNQERKVYLNFYKDPNNPKIDPMNLAEVVLDYVDTVLSAWKHSSDAQTAKTMVASLPLFVEMSKYLPHVNPKDTYDSAYRGTNIPENTIKKLVQSSNIKDWKSTKFGSYPFMVYVGPKKNLITYQPHRNVQSWSVTPRAAQGFGSVIVTVPLDDTFFFDPSFMGQYGYEHEKETVHFGKESMKAALLVPKDDFIDYRVSKRSDQNESINESEEIQDEEGTLTIPGL